MPRPPTSSPPASFPFTAGSFDFPHASASSSDAARSSAGNVLRLADEPPERAPADAQQPGGILREVRRQSSAYRRHLQRLVGPPGSVGRPRATPSERYLQRAQARIDHEREARMDAPAEPFDPLSERPPIIANFEEWIAMANRPPSPTAHDTPRTRPKRRKLGREPAAAPEYKGYRYGYKGQVVPGRLRMEVVSCDGGQIKRDNPMRMYNVDNVLKNDKSVYCSESSTCNLLLKHTGDAPFALEKLVVRAPDRGFTAPVQEGLIFVAMSPEELLSGTSSYHLQRRPNTPSASPSPRRPARFESLTDVRDAADDPHVWQYSRTRMQDEVEARIERLRLRTRQINQASRARAHPTQQPPEPPAESDDDLDLDCDYTTSAGVSAPTPPPFNVTTTSEEESSSNDDYPNVETMADRIQREGRWRSATDDEEDDIVSHRGTGARFRQLLETARFTEDSELRPQRIALGPRYRNLLDSAEPIRASRLTRPSRIAAGEGGVEGDESDGKNVLAPHARFFIKKNRHKITIKFEPAISGRNVLLKLWSPRDSEDGNIDIESVQFYGYSGPRYFQATEAC